MESLDKYRELAVAWVMTYGIKLAGAIIVFILGLYVAGWITKMVARGMRKRTLWPADTRRRMSVLLKSICGIST